MGVFSSHLLNLYHALEEFMKYSSAHFFSISLRRWNILDIKQVTLFKSAVWLFELYFVFLYLNLLIISAIFVFFYNIILSRHLERLSSIPTIFYSHSLLNYISYIKHYWFSFRYFVLHTEYCVLDPESCSQVLVPGFQVLGIYFRLCHIQNLENFLHISFKISGQIQSVVIPMWIIKIFHSIYVLQKNSFIIMYQSRVVY